MNFMLNRMNSFAIVIIVAMAGSCKSSKNTTADSKADGKPATLTESKTPLPENNYRVIVSFISIGGGTDSEAYAKLKDYISRKDEVGVAISKEEIRWGREGEVDVCFKLKEMDSSDADAFVNGLKKTFEGNNLVQITENTPALHQSRPALQGE